MDDATPTKDTLPLYQSRLPLGVIAMALHFDLEMLDLGMLGLGSWVYQALGMQKEGTSNDSVLVNGRARLHGHEHLYPKCLFHHC